MTVSISSVIKAYNHLLGREPESLEAVAHHLESPSEAVLRTQFIRSKEFQSVHGVFWVGQHLDESQDHIDLSATPEQMAAIITRTSATWRELGRSEPYWSVISDPAFLRASISKNEDKFY